MLMVGGRNLVAVARTIVASAEADGVCVRVFGSCAIIIQCETSVSLLKANSREPKDIDLVVMEADRIKLRSVLLAKGWTDDEGLTATTEARRMRFRNVEGILVDSFAAPLRFNQTLHLEERWAKGFPALSLPDLLLLKLQIDARTTADWIDTCAILCAHPDIDRDEAAEQMARVIELCSRSWRWYAACRKALRGLLDDGMGQVLLTPLEQSLVEGRAETLLRRIEDHPKSLAWWLRSIVGDSLTWIDRVEL